MPSVKPEEFKTWRKAMGFNQTKAAQRLGLKLRTVQYYEKGERKGKKVDIPKSVSLACYALSCGVTAVDYSTPLGRPKKKTETPRLEP
ncbi:MAG: helix-turn-helix domain-containing protein [Candidatus Puniceispirillales bacterium]